MLCEHYKDALTQAAAGTAAPSAELRAHLSECPSCRATLAEEQSLFAVIDSGIHALSNAEVPASLLPRVRARLDQAAAARFGWVHPLVFASAGVALTFAVFLLARPHRAAPEEAAKQGSAVPALTAPTTETSPNKTSSEGTQIAAIRVNHRQTSRNSTKRPFAASSNPEVLVPPGEREGLAQLVASLNEHRDLAAALVASRPEKKDALVTVDPLQISHIEIKPLEGAGGDTP